jgi:hypothetical protein
VSARDEKDDGGSAFPTDESGTDEYTYITGGLSKRDFFAAFALMGICADPDSSGSKDKFAKSAYQFADAMLVERAK